MPSHRPAGSDSAGSRPPRARQRLIGLAAGLALFCSVASLLPLRDTDVAVYTAAAERVFIDHADPYPRRPGAVLPFTYPPTALALLYPLARVETARAMGWMLGLNLVLGAIVMLVVVGDLARDDPSGRLLLVGPLYVAGFGGLYLTLVFGQVNLLLLLALWLYWRQVRRGRDGFGGGVGLTVGCIAKPHYAVLALAAGPRPGRRLLAGALAAAALVLALTAVVAPPGSWDSWLTDIVGTTGVLSLPPGHSSIAAPWNRSLSGAVARLLVPNKFTTPIADDPQLALVIATGLILAVAAVTVALVAVSMWRGRRGPVDRDLELSLLAVAVFLAAPASWTHHLVMLLPACLVLLRDGVLDARAPAASRLTAGLVLAVLALTLDDLLPREVRTASQPLMALMTVGVVGLWLLLAQRLGQRLRWRRP